MAFLGRRQPFPPHLPKLLTAAAPAYDPSTFPWPQPLPLSLPTPAQRGHVAFVALPQDYVPGWLQRPQPLPLPLPTPAQRGHFSLTILPNDYVPGWLQLPQPLPPAPLTPAQRGHFSLTILPNDYVPGWLQLPQPLPLLPQTPAQRGHVALVGVFASVWAYVQSTSLQGASSTSAESGKAFNSNVTIGNMLLVAVATKASGATVTVRDSQGNTYTQVGSYQGLSTAGKISLWQATAWESGPCTVYVDPSTATFTTFAIHEYQPPSIGSVSVHGTNTGSGTSTAPTSGSVTGSVEELQFAAEANNTSQASTTVGGSYTIRENLLSDGTKEGIATADDIFNTGGTESATFTLATSGGWVAAGASFTRAPLQWTPGWMFGRLPPPAAPPLYRQPPFTTFVQIVTPPPAAPAFFYQPIVPPPLVPTYAIPPFVAFVELVAAKPPPPPPPPAPVPSSLIVVRWRSDRTVGVEWTSARTILVTWRSDRIVGVNWRA